jgi:hypothetical protein
MDNGWSSLTFGFWRRPPVRHGALGISASSVFLYDRRLVYLIEPLSRLALYPVLYMRIL